jgi:hypothetical protein
LRSSCWLWSWCPVPWTYRRSGTRSDTLGPGGPRRRYRALAVARRTGRRTSGCSRRGARRVLPTPARFVESRLAADPPCSADAAPTTEVEPSPRATRQQARSPNALPPSVHPRELPLTWASLLPRAASIEGHSSGLTNRRHRPLANEPPARHGISVQKGDLIRYPIGRLPNKAMNLSKRWR